MATIVEPQRVAVVDPPLRFSDKIADDFTNAMGSWTFIGGQALIMAIWIILNTASWFFFHWDSYPFIFLNLAMSAEAAFATPVILMSGKRQDAHNQQVMQALTENALHNAQMVDHIAQVEDRMSQQAEETRKAHSAQLQDLQTLLEQALKSPQSAGKS